MSNMPYPVPEAPRPQPNNVQPHPETWQYPGAGQMVPPHVGYSPYGPAAPRQPSSGRIALFVTASAISLMVMLFGLLSFGLSFLDPNPGWQRWGMLAYGLITLGFSVFCVIRAFKTKLRPRWSIWLLLANVAVPAILLVLLLLYTALIVLVFASTAVGS